MNLSAKCVDGEMQIRDLDTDNADILCIVPLSDDEEYYKQVTGPFVALIVAAPELARRLSDLFSTVHNNEEFWREAAAYADDPDDPGKFRKETQELLDKLDFGAFAETTPSEPPQAKAAPEPASPSGELAAVPSDYLGALLQCLYDDCEDYLNNEDYQENQTAEGFIADIRDKLRTAAGRPIQPSQFQITDEMVNLLQIAIMTRQQCWSAEMDLEKLLSSPVSFSHAVNILAGKGVDKVVTAADVQWLLNGKWQLRPPAGDRQAVAVEVVPNVIQLKFNTPKDLVDCLAAALNSLQQKDGKNAAGNI